MGDVLRLAGAAHAVALDRLGQDHGRHALGVDGLVVGRIDLVRIVAAAVQAPDVVVGQVGDELGRFRVLAEEMFARVLAAEGLAVLVFAVDRFHHQLAQHALGVAGEERVPVAAPAQLDRVPAGAAEHAFEFLDDLAVAADRAVEALQIAVDHEDQVVEAFAPGQRNRAERLRFVGFAVADEAPDLAVTRLDQATVLEVLHELGLVNRLQRPKAHRDGRHLPVVGHQPRMRIRGQAFALALDFHAEVIELFGADATLEERTGIHARTRMALVEDQVAGVLVGRGAPEVVEADVVEGRARGETGDMAAEIARLAVGADDHGHRVPAHQRTDPPFHGRIARRLRLHVRRNRVDVLGGRLERQVAAGAPGLLDHALEQVMRALGAVGLDDRLQRFGPFPGFDRVEVLVEDVIELVHAVTSAWRAL